MAKRSRQELPTGLFTSAHYQMLINERRNLNDLIADIEKAGQCGVDCAVFKQMRADIDSQLEAIQMNFMTPPPTN